MGKSLVSCFLTHGVEQGHRVNCSPGRWIPGVTGSQNVTQFHVWWVISLFNDFFAVFDPSPLTPWINYSFYYLRTIGLSQKLLVLIGYTGDTPFPFMILMTLTYRITQAV